MKQPGYCGWDIGGAHLKVARCDKNGQLEQVIQLPCALWRGIEELQLSMQQALRRLDCDRDIHAITMTGELVDAFPHRRAGVSAIIDSVSQILPASNCQIYAAEQGWLTPEQAKIDWQAVASMNWIASADFAASQVESGLFIDIGSTTCDLVPISSHQVHPLGLTDHQRQISGSLVYTGAIRTPLMSLATEAPLNGTRVRLAAEWFASTADIWLLLDKLDGAEIQDSSADGSPWTAELSRQRLARMLAADADNASAPTWDLIAQWFAEKQLQDITEACLQVMTLYPLNNDSPIIGAGVGRFISEILSARLNRPYIDFASLCQSQSAAADHAPAAALALLAAKQLS